MEAPAPDSAVSRKTSTAKSCRDYFHDYASYYVVKVSTVLGKMHDTSDKFKEGNGILINQDYLKKVTVMVDKLLQLMYAVTQV